MSSIPPLARYEVGVVVERSKGASQWVDFHWRPITILAGAPDTPPWTKLTDDGERATFYNEMFISTATWVWSQLLMLRRNGNTDT